MDIASRRDEDGFSMMITMIVAMIVAGLSASLFVAVESGLKQTRRSGDSANALQVADAGVNAAVKRLADFTLTNPDGTPADLVIDETLAGTGDRYSVTARNEAVGVWHVEAIGFDSHGQKRRIVAVAAASPLFSNAVFTRSTMNFGSGVAVDSYIGGLTQAQTCNGRGIVGTNSPQLNDINVQGAGGGVRNCTEKIPLFPAPANPSGYVYDGCVGYARNEPVPRFLNENQNATKKTCGFIDYVTPEIELENVAELVDDLPLTANILDCSGPLNMAPGRYRYNEIRLRNGCVIPDSTATQHKAVELYTSGPVNIGVGSGSVVNQPPAPPSNCSGTSSAGTDYYVGTTSSPLWYYCSGWPGKMKIFASSGGTIDIAQHSRFWGVIYAPDRTIQGGPQPVMWGAIVASSIQSGAQVTIHYDEALSSVKTGRYGIEAWREEPSA